LIEVGNKTAIRGRSRRCEKQPTASNCDDTQRPRRKISLHYPGLMAIA